MPILAQTKPPCKHCKMRYEGCWDKCVDYLAYKKVHEAEKKWQHEQSIADGVYIRRIDRINREKRRRHEK